MDYLDVVIGGLFVLHLIWIGVIVGGTILAVTGWLSHHPGAQLGFNSVVVLTLLSHALLRGCALTLWQWGLIAARNGTSPSVGFLEYYVGLDDVLTAWIVEGLIVVGLVSQLLWWARRVERHE